MRAIPRAANKQSFSLLVKELDLAAILLVEWRRY